MSQKLLGTNEILGAFASQVSDEQLKAAIDSIAVEVNLAKNTDNEVHLALPYYSVNEQVSSFIPLDDEALEEIAGGEIAGTLAMAIIGCTAVGLGIAGGVTGIGIAASK